MWFLLFYSFSLGQKFETGRYKNDLFSLSALFCQCRSQKNEFVCFKSQTQAWAIYARASLESTSPCSFFSYSWLVWISDIPSSQILLSATETENRVVILISWLLNGVFGDLRECLKSRLHFWISWPQKSNEHFEEIIGYALRRDCVTKEKKVVFFTAINCACLPF